MKKLLYILLSLFFVVCICACEKAEYVEGEERQEQNNEEDYVQDDEDYDEGDFPLGSVVDVMTFKTNAIYTQVWVQGYIVGAATGAKNKVRYEFEPGFSYDTAILLSDNVDATSIDEAIPVCLTSCSKKLREQLNLVSHPENKGKRIAVFGFQDKYLKTMGIKKIDAYDFPL